MSDIEDRAKKAAESPEHVTESDPPDNDDLCSVADCFRTADGFEAVMVSAPPEAGSKEPLITFVLNVPLCGEHLHLARLADDSHVHLDT